MNMIQPVGTAHTEPVLVYCPGLGTYPANTADGVTDVLAAVLDRQNQGNYSAARLKDVTAPRGLVLGKTVLDPRDEPVLHVFELDYRKHMDPPSTSAGPTAPPGALTSALYAVAGLIGLLRAARHPAKTRLAKWQLFYGLIAVTALVLCAVVAILSWLIAAGAGSWLPEQVKTFFGLNASAVALTAGAVTVGGWALWRTRLLALAATVQRIMRYFDEERHRQTVTLTLTEAVDSLRDNGWSGAVHILGYSFGSLVAFDALFPAQMATSTNSRLTEAVESLTTIGCPVDAVRLYRGGYLGGRGALVKDRFKWTNIVNLADIFASNFRDDADGTDGGTPVPIAGRIWPIENLRYGSDELGLMNVLKAKGFRTHDGYWGTPKEASCFDAVVGRWVRLGSDTEVSQG
ncbi:MAG TPA: hypothetical protein DHU96_12530 [Actinobacteria bacterium]|nr:hypothetical protein [Actinomycetota bacterium]